MSIRRKPHAVDLRTALFRGRSPRTPLLAAAVFAVSAGVAGCAHQLVFTVLHPGDAFDDDDTPPPPDYKQATSWAALPAKRDLADVALDGVPKVNPVRAGADVFFVHTTTWLGRQWNGPTPSLESGDDVVENTARGSLLIQASVFNGCCEVYAPYYRQVNGKALTEPSPVGNQAIDVAYNDVRAAFDAFLARTAGRPFILASHSQGTVLATRLLREQVVREGVRERLVAAYLIGGPLAVEDLPEGIPPCEAADQTGCVVAFNARGPGFEPNTLEFVGPRGPSADPMAGRLCINPLSWRHDDVRVPATEHRGALFFDTEQPKVLPKFTSARCADGTLVVDPDLELPKRRVVDDILLWMMGDENYHPVEFQIFYLDLRANASERVRAFGGLSL